MAKTDGEIMKRYAEIKGIKEFSYGKCPSCKLHLRFVVCKDGTVNKVTSCGCTASHHEAPTTWEEVAKAPNLEILR